MIQATQLKGPGAKGPGAKGPGAKGPGAKGPGAMGQGRLPRRAHCDQVKTEGASQLVVGRSPAAFSRNGQNGREAGALPIPVHSQSPPTPPTRMSVGRNGMTARR